MHKHKDGATLELKGTCAHIKYIITIVISQRTQNQSMLCSQGIEDDHPAATAAAKDDDAEGNHNEDQRKWKEYIVWKKTMPINI